jgi:hypothetical protein
MQGGRLIFRMEFASDFEVLVGLEKIAGVLVKVLEEESY